MNNSAVWESARNQIRCTPNALRLRPPSLAVQIYSASIKTDKSLLCMHLPAVFVYGARECPYDTAQYMCIHLPRGLHSLTDSILQQNVPNAVMEHVLRPWLGYSAGGSPPAAPLQASRRLRPQQRPSLNDGSSGASSSRTEAF